MWTAYSLPRDLQISKRKESFRAREKYRSFVTEVAIVDKVNELTNVSRIRANESGNVAREHDDSEMLDIRGASPEGCAASPLVPAHTRSSAVILSYGGLYHQFSRPGSGAASSIGSQDISACLYGARCTLRFVLARAATLYRAVSNVP